MLKKTVKNFALEIWAISHHVALQIVGELFFFSFYKLINE